MATAITSSENALIILVGKLHPDYTVALYQPPNEAYPYIRVTDGKYESNIQIRLAKHHWDVGVIDRVVTKAIKRIEQSDD